MDIYLQNSSIVFTVEAQNVPLFTSEDLADQQVISKSQPIIDSINTPFGSRVFYEEGYIFDATPGRVGIQKDFYGEGILPLSTFTSLPDTLQESALKLAEMLKVWFLSSVGVNFTLVIENGNINGLVSNLPQQFKTEVLGFSIPSGRFTANFTLSKALKDDSSNEGVLVDINFSGVVLDKLSINSRLKQIQSLVLERSACLQKAKEVLYDLPLLS